MSFKASTNKLSNLEFQRIGVKSTRDVQEFVAAYFSPRDQLLKAANVPLEQAIELHRNRAKQLLKQNYSIGVFEKKSGALVAISLNSIRDCSEGQGQDGSPENFPYEWNAAKLRMLQLLEKNVFEELAAKKIFTAHMFTVHTSYSNMGLGKILEQKCQDLALELGCDCHIAHPTSTYSLSVLKHFGSVVLKRINLRHYIDEVTGTKPFENAKPPHDFICITYRSLGKSKL
ncbi:uncharacterized protein LOC144742719 [Ciona intestinalis]